MVIIKLLASILSGGILYQGFAPGHQALPATKIAGVITSIFTVLAFIMDAEGIFANDAGEKTEQLFWQSIEKNPSTLLYCDYLEKYPQGEFSGIAAVRVQDSVCPQSTADKAAPPATALASGNEVTSVESIVKVKLNATKPNGKAWDILNGKPDVYITVNGKSYRSDRCEDRFSCQFSIPAIQKIATIEVWDADELEDDPAGIAQCVPNRVCTTLSAKIKIITG
jgi:hypothetical protein